MWAEGSGDGDPGVEDDDAGSWETCNHQCAKSGGGVEERHVDTNWTALSLKVSAKESAMLGEAHWMEPKAKTFSRDATLGSCKASL